MKILVVGNGAREHALAWKFARSNRITGLYVAPGNAGTAAVGENLPEVASDDVDAIVRAAVDARVDLVFVGPEAPLAAGLVDALDEAGVAALGPHAEAARLEASKSFSKRFMASYGIPTADFRTFDDPATLELHLRSIDHPVVLKKSGLASGKGVIESDDTNRLVDAGRSFIDGGDEVVVEERLSGYEVSVFGLSDGSDYLLLPAATDYKKAGAGGSGPNTGGMGAISPVPWLPPDELSRIRDMIVAPTYAGLRDAGLLYRGVLYFGVMITESGPRLLEYNVRFGDPEAQVVLPLVESDLANLCDAVLRGTLSEFPLRVSRMSALGVVIAAPGYPSDYPTGIPVETLPPDDEAAGLLFHAATRLADEGVVTGGGRCFTAVGVDSDILTARTKAYTLAKEVRFNGSWFRPDIGGRIFG